MPEKRNPAPSWPFLVLLFTILGWTIAWAIGHLVLPWGGWGLRRSDPLSSLLGGVVCGLIGGVATGLVLHFCNLFANRKSILWISLGWILAGGIHHWIWELIWNIGWAMDYGDELREALDYGWGIFGLLGGLATAIVLLREQLLPSRWGLVWIPLAWGFGWRVGLYYPGDWFYSPHTSDLVYMTIGGVMAGLVGGLVTIWQIRAGLKAREEAPTRSD